MEERTVTVERQKLICTLKENRSTHSEDYQQAVRDYKDLARDRLAASKRKAEQRLEDRFARISQAIDRFDPDDDELTDRVTVIDAVTFNLRVPQDHTKAYNVAIQMAEWEVGDTVELTQFQFQCFVLDDWDWKPEFARLQQDYAFANSARR